MAKLGGHMKLAPEMDTWHTLVSFVSCVVIITFFVIIPMIVACGQCDPRYIPCKTVNDTIIVTLLLLVL